MVGGSLADTYDQGAIFTEDIARPTILHIIHSRMSEQQTNIFAQSPYNSMVIVQI